MKRLLIYVEGQTEETFVRDVLAPYLWTLGLHPEPTLARTKRTRSGQTFKGGITSHQRVGRDIRRLLGDSQAVAVTTMLDYYHLPGDFPGKDSLPASSCYERVRYLETQFEYEISEPRFVPFLTLHEFEALLFSQAAIIESAFPDSQIAGRLTAEAALFATPEEINEGADTHPAARILKHAPGYRKPLHGPLIANRIGLATIRSRCPHFDQWLTNLAELA